MKRSWLRLGISSMLALGAFAAAFLIPESLTEGPFTVAPRPERPVISCRAVSGCDPSPPANFLARLEEDLTGKMPDLDPSTRRALARTVVAEARAAALDPLLVLALIEVESSFDPTARSNRAVGLMQLDETTMRRERERAGLPPADPQDPVANVQSGVRYLRRLLDAFPREELALMAYNAGPNRILGYLREGAVPERFAAYPRRIGTELRRLRKTLGVPSAEVAQAKREPDRAAPSSAVH